MYCVWNVALWSLIVWASLHVMHVMLWCLQMLRPILHLRSWATSWRARWCLSRQFLLAAKETGNMRRSSGNWPGSIQHCKSALDAQRAIRLIAPTMISPLVRNGFSVVWMRLKCAASWTIPWCNLRIGTASWYGQMSYMQFFGAVGGILLVRLSSCFSGANCGLAIGTTSLLLLLLVFWNGAREMALGLQRQDSPWNRSQVFLKWMARRLMSSWCVAGLLSCFWNIQMRMLLYFGWPASTWRGLYVFVFGFCFKLVTMDVNFMFVFVFDFMLTPVAGCWQQWMRLLLSSQTCKHKPS